MEDQPATPPPASSSSCWSSVLKNQATAKPPQQQSIQNGRGLVESCKSAHGVSVAVVDANAIIDGGEKLHSLADKFVSVPEVMEEIRDPVSRHKLSFLPFTIDTMEPTPEAINKVVKFARATGDLQTLSDVDLKLIALTYTLEAQIHGTQNLRESPPPVQTVNVPRLPEKDMPGWGSNVPNMEEWEALEHQAEDKSNSNSRILPLKDLNLKVAVTVGENGIVMAARRPRVTLRGTKFSLPLPKGGRDAVTKNLILREDQLPQRVLYPKTKKANKKDDDIFASGSVFTHHTDKRAPFQPPIRKALAVFSGRRNPNDNHYSGSRHK
ncbi:uncharacterized protein LOC107617322 [Arachis ipaensis]|uniref:uncharacterized protein LOC107617322 n=1 Tax=Arachis ipaensis TaxID=130454 RepID=UPI0007AFADB1|nr:uncharacterized protein LOC107617322 [Arachis ipaensis]XP_016174547.1 uncharacterized protein LOC107617322 [Arachis ipaensis]